MSCIIVAAGRVRYAQISMLMLRLLRKPAQQPNTTHNSQTREHNGKETGRRDTQKPLLLLIRTSLSSAQIACDARARARLARDEP